MIFAIYSGHMSEPGLCITLLIATILLLGFFYVKPVAAFKALCISFVVGALTANPFLAACAGGVYGCCSLVKWLDDPQ